MQNGGGQRAAIARSPATPPSLDDAARALDAIDACLLGLLPARTSSGGEATWPTPERGWFSFLSCFPSWPGLRRKRSYGRRRWRRRRLLSSARGAPPNPLLTPPPLLSHPTPRHSTAAQRAEALVDASATISRALGAFGAASSDSPTSSAGERQERRLVLLLRRSVAGLEAERRNADALLARARAGAGRWRAAAEAAKAGIEHSLELPPDAGAAAR
jgi:hypothetical protein